MLCCRRDDAACTTGLGTWPALQLTVLEDTLKRSHMGATPLNIGGVGIRGCKQQAAAVVDMNRDRGRTMCIEL